MAAQSISEWAEKSVGARFSSSRSSPGNVGRDSFWEGRLMENAPAARSLRPSRSAKHGATEPGGWGPAAMMNGEPGREANAQTPGRPPNYVGALTGEGQAGVGPRGTDAYEMVLV